MSFSSVFRGQDVTVWVAEGFKGDGTPKFREAIIHKAVVTEEEQRILLTSGREVISTTRISLTNAKVKPGDWIYIGLDTSSQPPTEAREVVKVTTHRFAYKNSDRIEVML